MNYFKEIIHGTKTLLTGMNVTGVYFFRNLFTRKDIITQQYPDNIDTLKMFDRFKGEVIMGHNKLNQHKCDACTMCEIACPNGSIEIVFDKQPNPHTGKPMKVLTHHIYHLEMCTMCGLCIEACPQDAIEWGQGFHHTTGNRGDLTKSLNKPGSELDPSRIKKPKPKPAAKPKPAVAEAVADKPTNADAKVDKPAAAKVEKTEAATKAEAPKAEVKADDVEPKTDKTEK